MIKKVILWIVAIACLTLVFVLQDWYRFAKYSEIDPQRGIFGNSHLEVWIDINARMPSPMRKWACKTLLDREAAVIGGTGRAPYGCEPDFDDPPATRFVNAFVNSAKVRAERAGTAEQATAVVNCMQTDFVAKLSAEQLEAITNNDAEVVGSLSEAAIAAGDACLAAQGLN
ncbi:hypothetical protein [Tabrizicola sp.]|uniref:hypothetical protein n=1 Tax=Tabrizicola sp. TaxID=2005166 RepID=UPI003F325CF3